MTFTDNAEIDAAALKAGKEPVKVEGIEDGKVVEIVRNHMP